ncbi:unnamed protein product [Rhizophagus irregularis]|nr:unnamed protein product [Rhizophagus irregularis]
MTHSNRQSFKEILLKPENFYQSKIECYVYIFRGEVTVQSFLQRHNCNKKILEEKLDHRHLADLLCHTDFYEVLCLLACGSLHKVDLTKFRIQQYKSEILGFEIFGLQELVNDLFDKLVNNEEIGSTIQQPLNGDYKLNPTNLFKFFKNKATRNHLAHMIIQLKGRWNDEKLHKLSAIALKIVVYLGDDKAFKPLKEFKQKLESELMEWRIPVKRKHKECEENESIRKKSLKDIDLRKLLDFSLHIMSKLESDDKKQLKQIVQLVVNIDDAFVNI